MRGVRAASSAPKEVAPSEQEGVGGAAQQAAPSGLVLVGQAQQLVGIAERNSPAVMRSASLIVR